MAPALAGPAHLLHCLTALVHHSIALQHLQDCCSMGQRAQCLALGRKLHWPSMCWSLNLTHPASCRTPLSARPCHGPTV